RPPKKANHRALPLNSRTVICTYARPWTDPGECVNRESLYSRAHGFLISGGDDGAVEVFFEGDDLAVADGEDVGEVAAKLATGVFHAPLVVAERNDFVALRNKFKRLER